MSTKKSPSPAEAFSKLEEAAYIALQMYSNVHRGAGHNSLVSTRLFDQSRDVVLDYLGLDAHEYVVVFANSQRAKVLKTILEPDVLREVTSREIGLPLGVCALAIRKDKLPEGVPYETGGGTVRVVSENHVLWAGPPDRFEAGTPAILNIIAFARALQLIKQNPQTFNQKTGDPKKLIAQMKKPAPAGKQGKALLTWLKPRLVGRNVLVPTEMGKIPYTNLDNGASTPSFEPVWECFRQTLHLPESEYGALTQEAGKICMDFVGAPEKEYELIFTSNTTEGLNTFARLASASLQKGEEMLVLNSLIEHNSNELPWRCTPGLSLVRLEADGDGFIDISRLEKLLSEHNRQGSVEKPVRWVSISGASNVLGALNDLESISAVTHKYGAKLLVDAAQLIAHRSIQMQNSDIDALVFSGHKVYAPFGAGALILRKTAFSMDQKMVAGLKSSGEENVAGIASLAAVFSLLAQIGMEIVEEDERVLTIQLLDGLEVDPWRKGLRYPGWQSPPDAPPQRGGHPGTRRYAFQHRLKPAGGGRRSGCAQRLFLLPPVGQASLESGRFPRAPGGYWIHLPQPLHQAGHARPGTHQHRAGKHTGRDRALPGNGAQGDL